MSVPTPELKQERPATDAGKKEAQGARKPGRKRRWPYVLGGVVAVLALAVFLFRWDWLIPIVNSQASAALGRPVTVKHLHVKLGWVPHIELEGITIANPPGWEGGGNFATIERLGLDVDARAYMNNRQLVLPNITVDKPVVEAAQLADGRANWTFPSGDPDKPASGPETKIGNLRINDGRAHVVSAKLAADFNVDVGTKDENGQPSQIVASAKGTYAKQPITAQFTGGALLSLREENQPYPVNLQLQNGPTKLAVTGTVQNPLNFAGANVKLDLAGPDMSLLLPLTGVAIPKTPAYRIAGQLDYSDGVVDFSGFEGKVGSSDLAGNLQVDTKPERPVVTADLQSNLVDLRDLGGFIGAEPGDASKGTKRPERGNGRVLPDDPISLPKLNAADVHLTYQAARIQGRGQPLDNMRAELDIENGNVDLHPVSFGIGRGQIAANIKLSAQGQGVRARADIDFQRVDVGRLLAATGAARGAGSIGGKAVIEGTGRSLAEILANGNGELKLYMGAGGNVSAVLVDLSGLQFGNALLSALGIPNRERIQCFITDFVLRNGVATARTAVLDTEDHRTGVNGTLNFRNESIRFTLKTEAKNFSIGSLPAPVNVTGTLANPSIMPDLGEAGVRAGAAVGLGFIAPPLALLPTIQLGTGEDGACAGLLKQATTPPRVPANRPARPAARQQQRR